MTAKEKFWEEPVGNLPLQKPVIEKVDSTIVQAIKSMQKNKTGCVLINNNKNELVGIFTERDVMLHFVGTDLGGETPLSEVMTEAPITLTPETSVAEVIKFLGQKKFRHLPIGEDGKILGLLSVRVMVDFIAEHLPHAILNLPPEEGLVSKDTVGG